MDANAINIDHLAKLAALRLGEGERPAVLCDLRRIIAMVDQMQAVDVRGVSPLAHPLDAALRLRPDEVTEEIDRALYQGCAPAAVHGAGAEMAGSSSVGDATVVHDESDQPTGSDLAGSAAVRDGLYIVPRAVE